MEKLLAKHKCIIENRKDIDYTEEINRCLEFIFKQHNKGISWKDAFTQAETSYGYHIVDNVIEAIKRKFN